jgi:hypothetical protein
VRRFDSVASTLHVSQSKYSFTLVNDGLLARYNTSLFAVDSNVVLPVQR